MNRGVFFSSLLVVPLLTVVSTFQISSGLAHNSHVEYIVPEQDGIEVVQHGRAGLVEVEVTHCLTAGEPFSFNIVVMSEREGDSDLTVRKNSGVDISTWFSLDPAKVPLPGETTVVVTITPPAGVMLDKVAVVRIQEIGDPPTPGGHHGVKVKVTCVEEMAITPTPTPTPSPTSTPTPTPTPPVALTPSAIATPEAPETPTSEAPVMLPPTGGQPSGEEESPLWKTFLGGGLLLIAIAGHPAWRRLRQTDPN